MNIKDIDALDAKLAVNMINHFRAEARQFAVNGAHDLAASNNAAADLIEAHGIWEAAVITEARYAW